MMWALLIFVVLAALVLTNRIAEKTYVGKLLLGFDFFVSVMWDRDFDLTISSRTGMYWRQGHPPLFWKLLHIGLNMIQKDHCELAMAADLARAQAAIKLLGP